MPYQDHLVGANCFTHSLDVLDGAPKCIVVHVGQEIRQTTSGLIEEKDAKTLLGEAAVNRLVKWSLAHPGPAMKKDYGCGVNGHARRRVKLAVSDSRPTGQLPVARIFK